jgi:hypothetical protein
MLTHTTGRALLTGALRDFLKANNGGGSSSDDTAAIVESEMLRAEAEFEEEEADVDDWDDEWADDISQVMRVIETKVDTMERELKSCQDLPAIPDIDD